MRISTRQAEAIEIEVANMLRDYGIGSFPIDVFDLCGRLGIGLVRYSDLQPEIAGLARSESSEGFSVCNGSFGCPKIVYNDARTTNRVRFTIAHEIGHLWLEHTEESPEREFQADYFAGYLLAPHPLLAQYGENHSSRETARMFGISSSCLEIALDQLEQRRMRDASRRPHEWWLAEYCTLREGAAMSELR